VQFRRKALFRNLSLIKRANQMWRLTVAVFAGHSIRTFLAPPSHQTSLESPLRGRGWWWSLSRPIHARF